MQTVTLRRDDDGRIRAIEAGAADGKIDRVARFDAEGKLEATDGRRYPLEPRPLRGVSAGVERQAKKVRKDAEALTAPVDVVFLGDSITHTWPVRAASGEFSSFKAGVGSFQTMDVLRQLHWGLLRMAKPRLVVLQIGTNNNGSNQMTPVETALSIAAILAKIHADLPEARILLLGILPRGRDSSDPVRGRNEETNSILRGFEGDPRIRYLDTSRVFVDEEGRALPEMYRDADAGVFLHPSGHGYRAWNRPVGAAIAEILRAP